MPYPVTLNGRTYTAADFDGQAYVTGLPDALQDFVTHAGSLYTATSTTSVAIGTGSKSFTVQTGKPYQVGTVLRIASTASPSTNWMDGVVTSYTSGTGALVVNVTGISGSGTLASWSINLAGGGYAVGSPVTIAQGGTGAVTASAALTALGAVPLAGGTMTGALTAPSPLTVTATSFPQWVLSDTDAAVDARRWSGWINTDGTFQLGTQTDAGTGTAILTITRAGVPTFTQQILGPAGTTGAPAHSFSTDTNSGIRSGGADILHLVTGATDRLSIDAAGNYGVGVTPNNVTDCRIGLLKGPNSGAGYGIIAVECGLNTKQGVFQINSANGHVDIGTAVGNTTGNLGLMAGGATRLSIQAGGEIQPAAASNIVWTGTGDHFVGYNPTTEHAAGNVNNMVFGTEDGGGWTGFVVTDFRESTVNSQQCDIMTAKGSVSVSTVRARFTCEGYSIFGPAAPLSLGTPGYGGNTTYGNAFFPTGRAFFYQDSFSTWGMHTTGTLVNFQYQNTSVGSIGITTTTTSFNTTSDHRLKENETPLTGALDRLDQLQPYRFNFIADPDTTMDGFFAHEVQSVVPEAVTGEADGEDFGGNPIYQGLDQSKLVPLLVAAVQELRAEFNAYKATHP